jgi:hypothetical protein
MITVSNTSPFSGKENTMDLNCTLLQFQEGERRYAQGSLIQDAFPFLNADEREFIKTGITPEEWDNMFGGEE